MAVPFRKVSKTRRDMRRTHYKVTANGLENVLTVVLKLDLTEHVQNVVFIKE